MFFVGGVQTTCYSKIRRFGGKCGLLERRSIAVLVLRRRSRFSGGGAGRIAIAKGRCNGVKGMSSIPGGAEKSTGGGVASSMLELW